MKHFYSFKIIVTCLMLVSIITIPGCESTSTEPTPPDFVGSILLVANYAAGSGNMSLIELESGAMITEAAGLGNIPNDIIEFDDRIFVINTLSNDMNVLRMTANNTLEADTVIDLGNGNPQKFAVASNGHIYISNYVDNDVIVYDVTRSRVLANLPVGTAPADVIATNNNVYICNTGYTDLGYEPGTVSIIPLSSGFVEGNISVGTNPQYMAIDSNGKLHVVCTGTKYFTPNIEGEINIINTEADTVESYIYIGGDPRQIAINSDGIAYVTAGGNEQDGYVFRYNAFTGQILNGPDNPIEVGQDAWSVVADEDGSVYVSCYSNNSVYKIVGDEVKDIITQVGENPGSMLIYRK